jgi:hypothetical protein
VIFEHWFSRLIKTLTFRYYSEGYRCGAKLVRYRNLERWFWPGNRPGDTDAIIIPAGGDLEPGTRNPDVAEEHKGFYRLEQNQR